MSAKKKIKGFKTHLPAKHFKVSKAKTKHELQHDILSMSNHHLAVVDAIVNAVSEGKKLNPVFYPQVDLKHLRGVAQKLKGHTSTQIQLARRAQSLPGGGAMDLFNAGVKMVKPAAKVAWTGLKAGAKMTAKWVLEHPDSAIKLGQTAVAVGTALLESDSESESEEMKTQKPHHREAIDDLLLTSEDEKGGSLVPVRRKPKRDNSRWVI